MGTYQYKFGDRPLEGYTIQRAAGRGGFGEVYYAVSDSGRHVAIKAIQGCEEIELRGITQCMNLKSPHLVTIFDVKHSDQGRPFVIMEYVSGPSLADLLKESPGGLGSQKAAFFLREIGKGLSFLHQCGIVHRDLKPGNIFYENSYVKIGDYGLTKAIGAGSINQTIMVGTFHYMAPEIGAGRYGRSIDIYALGVLLYEMLTGQVPFLGASPAEILMKHMTAVPDLTNIEEPFARVIRNALAKDPADRYQSVQEMVEEVFGTEHIRNSVSQFSPEELSVLAEHVAQKMRQGGPQAPVQMPAQDGAGMGGAAKESDEARIARRVPDDLVEVADAEYASLVGLALGGQEAQDRQRQAVQQSGLPLEVQTRKTGIVLRLLPAGGFMMGSRRNGDSHEVTLTKAFYCAKFEVTQRQWEQVMGYNPSKWRDAGIDAPVNNVSWKDCHAFLKKLCQIEGVAEGMYRLPTEAQWEYACRAGTQTDEDHPSDLDTTTKIDDDRTHAGAWNVILWWRRPKTPPAKAEVLPKRKPAGRVGNLGPNAWGLYDMPGEVFEWCQDRYGEYARGAVIDPQGPPSGVERVLRGWGFVNSRDSERPDQPYVLPCGFRIVRTLSSHA